MTDRIRVNTGNLGRTREQVSSHIRQIKEQVAAMYGDISSLGTMWEGEAHSTFDSEFRKDVGRLENLCGDGRYTKTIVCPDGCVLFRLTAKPLGNENFHKGGFWKEP